MHSSEVRQQALTLFEEGLNYRVVAERLNIPPYTVREWYYIYKREHEDENETLSQALLRDKAFELFQKGLGYRAVSSTLNLSPYTARSWQRSFEVHFHHRRNEAITPVTFIPEQERALCQAILEQAVERDHGEGVTIIRALKEIVEIIGFEKVAQASGISETRLRKAFAACHTIRFSLVLQVITALGLKLG